MVRLNLMLLAFMATAAHGFVVTPNQSFSRYCLATVDSKKNADDAPEAKPSLAVGTILEFEEKGRCHVGRIDEVEHKSNGNNRYEVHDNDGKHYSIAEKEVHFSVPSPTNEPAAIKLFTEMTKAQTASEQTLRDSLDVSPELLELVWETALEEQADVTPRSLIQELHSHAASHVEAYMAWRLLQTDLAHVFFKDLKHHGKIVSFKTKAQKAVEAAKQSFCATHKDEEEFCFV